jgi:PTS system galactitol-specific IIA component
MGAESMQISEFLHKELIVTDLEVESKEELFNVLYEKLYNSGFVKKSFLAGIKSREEKFPTGLQLSKYGVALPHTDPEHVILPAIAIATLAEPVEFKNMALSSNDLNVNVVFMMALKEANSQVEMLQKLACLIQNDSQLEKIVHAKKGGEIIEIIKNSSLSNLNL